MNARFSAEALKDYAHALLMAAGLDAEKAEVVAATLLEGDLLGHTTHGLVLLPSYLAELEKGAMEKIGGPDVLADFPAAVTWDGRRLPGPWLVERALDLAAERAVRLGTCTVVIRRSHHIACLEAFLKKMTDQGLIATILCSDPAGALVAPHGGSRGVITPNPLASGWPTRSDPVLVDVSMSTTSFANVKRLQSEQRTAPAPWFVTAEGAATSDPAALFSNPPGALLPIGGTDHGHKGYGLGLWVEAMTSGLAGHGRADAVKGWGANVFIQVLDPRLFAGQEAFVRETTHLAETCRTTKPQPGVSNVRLPGEAGLQRRARQLAEGVDLHPSILPALKPWAEKLKVSEPARDAVPRRPRNTA